MSNTTVENLAESQVEPSFDADRHEKFGERAANLLNEAALGFMFSLGHRSGLFDAMGRMDRPATSSEIAEVAKLNERYVREWLGALVTGDVVEYDAALKTYYLPQEHAAWLTRAASPANVSVVTQFLAVFGKVEDQILKCFEQGGGVPYEQFDRFHEVMAEESSQTVVAALDDYILPLAVGLEEKLEAGIEVADVGCGRGMAIIHMAKRFPRSNFVGFDFSQEAISWAQNQVAERGLSNVSFELRDAAKLNEDERFDLVFTFDSIHDQIDPKAMLAGIYKSLKNDGMLFAQDIRSSSHVEKNCDHPLGTFLYTISTMHCMTVSLAHDGCGLGTCWGEELAVEMFEEAGFVDVTTATLEHDLMNNYYLCRKE